jgi:hypothetical protein
VTLEELRHDIARMDRVELLAFGPLTPREPRLREVLGSPSGVAPPSGEEESCAAGATPYQLSSEELTERAKAAGPGRYPWIRYDD